MILNMIIPWSHTDFKWDKHITGILLFGIILSVTLSPHIRYFWIQLNRLHKTASKISEHNWLACAKFHQQNISAFTLLYLNIKFSVQILFLPYNIICYHMFSDIYLDYILEFIQILIWIIYFSSCACKLFRNFEDGIVLEYTESWLLSESNNL